ncbi:hypothetical protein [Streptomyces sp. NPDC048111]|uniref:hypothetical protein n=1 Tax=Streptomyces sp. NPDC048111 TaxID=3365500 RepID=UPI003723E6CE
MTTDARPPGPPRTPPPRIDPGPVLPDTPRRANTAGHPNAPMPPAPSASRPPEIPPLPAAPSASPSAIPPLPSAPPKPLLPPEPLSDEPGPLRPVPARRPGRVAAAAVCVVLGIGLIGGAAAGTWLGDDSAGAEDRGNFTAARALWHSVPVDTLFPPTIHGTGAGPGGADRAWTRIGVAPDSGCAGALDPLLLKVLEPVGCARMVRATYTDATHSSVTTVGLVFTEADPAAMTALANRFSTEKLATRTDLMPRAYPVKGTDAASFGDKQRASWTVRVLTDAPVVVTAASGFADGRTVATPRPAEQATAPGANGPVAEAGLGHDAKGIADTVERGLRKRAAASPEPAK